jgi:hypothetical protein
MATTAARATVAIRETGANMANRANGAHRREYGCWRCEGASVTKRALAVIDSFTGLS